MKNLFIYFLIFFIFLNIGFSGTPTLNGSFDGVATWGTPVATADGTAVWNSANAKKIYVTYDGTYYYFGAEIVASDWHQWAFAIVASQN